ncbi:thiopeptide-type bacteriocin biosynthesis protein [Streptomyces sp. NRRL S-495]|uniref:thiopeptide-type bacteriocin biosynthesis protein n=1 Tax=Streptomyces sp. NRRL S-495 TaxID=1609133 RepID=UPI00099C4C05|nr:thiopeptide-type bacteriocin biosynthesis protein [Streptomyces sp. NRRL S-495]
MTDSPSPDLMEKAVLAVLAGTPLPKAAVLAGMPTDALTSALDLYRVAGLAALTDHADEFADWVQVYVHPSSWRNAEQDLATHLGPYLRQAENSGAVNAWWYVRKHPCWRIRLHPGPATTSEALRQATGRRLDALRREGVVTAWWPGIYEPETAALGGPAGIAAAHDLFHADSRAILTDSHLADTDPNQPAVGRPELSMLLCSHLLRAAGQEWTEQGDVWHRVAQMRPATSRHNEEMVERVGSLLAADTTALTGPGGRLEHAGARASVFHTAGRTLAAAAGRGELTRGLRAVLAQLVVFHWNRADIPTPAQAALARAARDHILGPPGFTP